MMIQSRKEEEWRQGDTGRGRGHIGEQSNREDEGKHEASI